MSAYLSGAVRMHIFSRGARSILPLSLILLLPCIPAVAQQSDTTEKVDRHTIQELLDRIASLEASDKQLRDRVAQLEKGQSGTAAAQASPPVLASLAANVAATAPAAITAKQDPAKTDPPPAQSEQSGSMQEPDHMDVSKTAMNIRGFGDFGLYGGNQKGQTTSFSIGQMNLFITSNMGEHFKFLSELVFEVHQDNAFQEDLERIFLEYSANDYFNLVAGRYHTAIGYYNTAYHHATWFQTTTGRPYVFQFEDEGGILPIHTVGLEASGLIPSGSLGLHYVVEAGNGRSSNPLAEPVQNYVDEDTHKAANVAVFARPDKIPGLQVGFSAYRDIQTPPNYPKINETILDAYTVLSRPKFEWLNEALMIRHAPLGQHVFETPAFYSQISERFGQYQPYLRYQYINASSQDPVFPRVGLRTGPSVGIRFDPSESVALKLQYDYTELRRQGFINGASCPQLSMCAPSALAMQVDYKF